MNVNLYVIEDYENETAFRPQKNKPKQSQWIGNELKSPISPKLTKMSNLPAILPLLCDYQPNKYRYCYSDADMEFEDFSCYNQPLKHVANK